jgi:medium-chain acyl-[acyl-carrier-protein] hydrolase
VRAIRPNDWVVIPAPRRTARVRLLCCSHAGGGASSFRRWPAALAPDIEAVSLQPPGRENRVRERPLSRVQDIVAEAVPAIQPILGGSQLALFGHSMGGLVAFELARALRDSSPIAHLFVSACGSPRVPRPSPPRHLLPDADFIGELRALGGTPEEVLRDDVLRFFLPVLRADFAANDTYAYHPGRPLTCPITVFGGETDCSVTVPQLRAWALETSAPFELRMLAGDHFFIEPHMSVLTNAIANSLACVR